MNRILLRIYKEYMRDSAIEVKNVTKIFKVPHERRNTMKEYFVNIFHPRDFEKMEVLKDISFTVKKGEFLGIIGRNGSGKSTLLKIIAGILQPNSGQVVVNGTIAPFLELGVGFQPDLSARDNVYLYGAILGLSRETINKKFSEIIKFAELEKFVDQKLKNFSSGMQVRLAFATAIHAEADILLVDEVLAVGDISFQKKCFEAFRKLKEEGKTIIFVSHDLSAVEQFTERVVWLDQGKVMMNDKASVVIDTYFSKQTIVNREMKKRVGKRWGSQEVEITKINFINNGDTTNIFKSGDDIEIVLEYKNNQNIEEARFGIAIYDNDYKHLYGSSSEVVNLECKVGKIKLRLPFFCIISEKVYFTFAISDVDSKSNYDWHEKMYSLSMVRRPIRAEGKINLGVIWKV